MAVRKNVLTKEALLKRLNELCVKHGVYRYGKEEAEIHRKIRDMKGRDDYDYCPYFDDEDVIEDNGLSFTVKCIAMSASDRNRLKVILQRVAKEWHVRFDGKRSKLKIEHNPSDDDLQLPDSWSFTWFFSPNE